MEHFPEQLIIGKSVPGEQFSYACIGAEDIFANVGKPYLVNEFQKGDSHIFFEKTAEIFRIQRDERGSVTKAYAFVIMGIHIIHNRDQTGAFFVRHGTGLHAIGSLKAGDTQKQQFVKQAGKMELIPLGFALINIPDFFQTEAEGFIRRGIPAGTIEKTDPVEIRNVFL